MMNLFIKKSKISGEVAVPGSKSHTIRGIICAMNSTGTCKLNDILKSEDTVSALNAIRTLGSEVVEDETSFTITGIDKERDFGVQNLDLGNSGTSLRLLTAATALLKGEFNFDGDSSLRTRKMQPLLDALTELGVESTSTDNSTAPLSIKSQLIGGDCRVSGVTSQFLSALLFATPFAKKKSTISLDFLNEAPYVEITLNWLNFLGIKVKHSEDLLHFEVEPNQTIKPFNKTIPADFSTALFPSVAALLCGKSDKAIVIKNLDFEDKQGDKEVFKIFEAMRAKVIYNEDNVEIYGNQKLSGGEFDLNRVPDALPILSVLAATLEGETTKLYNVAQARIKETDRIACMTTELRKMGAIIEELPDGMIITGTKLNHCKDLESYDDHRIAMALTIASMSCDENDYSVVKNIECASVTYPNFVKDFIRLGADIEVR